MAFIQTDAVDFAREILGDEFGSGPCRGLFALARFEDAHGSELILTGIDRVIRYEAGYLRNLGQKLALQAGLEFIGADTV